MHVFYIHTHDSGRLFSPYGYDVPSNNLLDFAKDATTFANAYCVNPTCSPSRASLLTGQYPHQNGMLGLAQRGFSLYDYDKHLCNFLKHNGYHSVLCGIQHEVDFYLNVEASKKLGYDEILTNPTTDFKAHKEDLHIWDEQNVDTLIDWMKNYHEDAPLFISYGMHSTHRPFPIEIDKDIDERFTKPIAPLPNREDTRKDTAQYLTSAKNADHCFGKLMQAIKDLGWYDDSIILFTTDHGVAFPFNKCFLNDKGIGVSLLMRVPGSKTNGVVESLISHIDVFPTLCDLLHLEKPDYLEGESFAKVFEGEKLESHDIFAEINFHTSYEPIRAVRTDRYKYIRYFDTTHLKINPSNTDTSLSKGFYMDYDYTNYKKDEEALYDTYYDPDEKNNLINDPELQDVVEELRKKLYDFQVRTNDPILEGKLPIKPTYKVNKPDCIDASSKNPDDYEEEGTFY